MRSKDNRGFSLIELIVAVLIMAIVAGSAIMAVSVVNNAKTEKAALLVSNVLRQARQKAISIKNDGTADSQVYLHFYIDDGNVHADLHKIDGTSDTKLVEEKIGNDSVSLTLRKADVTNPSSISDPCTLDDANDFKIYFKKSTGGISKITYGSTEKNDMNEIYITGVGDDRKIILVGATGRAYYDE